MALDRILTDGSETGESSADKINASFAEVDVNTQKVSNVDHPVVSKAVPSDAVFTDTVYDDSDVLKDSDTKSPVTDTNKLLTEADSGSDGEDGKGWTNGYYVPANGTVVFESDDGLGFTTEDLRGADGIQGEQGIQGLKGDDGLDGADGTSVTIKGSDTIENILLKPGVVGDMWISTNDGLDGAGAAVTAGDGIIYDEDNLYWITVGPIQGPKGDDGIQGETGVAGDDGLDGAKGDTGDQGPAGIDGNDGAQGIQGIQGIQGEPGLDGEDGLDGAIGPAGPSTPSVDADNELTTGSDTLLYYKDPEVTFAGLGSRGYVPDPISENDYVLHDDGTWKLQAVSPIGGTSLRYSWDSDTTATAPDEGDIKANNVDQTIATELYVSDTSRVGNNVGIFWESQDVGDYIGMWEEGNQGHESDYYLVIGPVVNNGTWYTVPVEFRAGTGGIDDKKNVTAFFIDNPKNQLPAGGTVGQVLAKATDLDYETEWVEMSGGGTGEATITPYERTATNGQTVFSIPYGTSDVIATRNGMLLAQSDYTLSGGNTLTLTTGAAFNDLIIANVYSDFVVTNAVTSLEMSQIIVLTQAQYDAITPEATTMYAIVG